MHLPSLTDEELISLVRVKMDATELEKELARRLADVSDHNELIDGLEKQIEQLEDDKEHLEGQLDDIKSIIGK